MPLSSIHRCEDRLPFLRTLGASCQLLCLVLFLFLSVGCDSNEVRTYPVTGMVKFDDGTPLTTGWIRTRPEPLGPEQQVFSARSAIGRDGSFALGTIEENDGAVAGKHAVLIEVLTARELGNGFGATPEALANMPDLAQRYRTYGTSGLEIDVLADDAPQHFDLEVTAQ